MSYAALEENTKRRLRVPENGDKGLDLKAAAVRFLHERCENLRFSKDKTNQEKEEHIYSGKSLKTNQIPYNMQMDIDRLCLENAVKDFIEFGTAQDAFNIYFCYLEMFVGEYGQSRRMIELLSEYEMNASSLLMKHRDHYSHSVYVFILGLAIYETSSRYRAEYKAFYKESKDLKNIKEELGNDADEEKAMAHHYLQYWGLASLFHDIGYPFELPFEQVEAYFEVHGSTRKESPFVAYQNLENYVKIDEETKNLLKEEVYCLEDADFQTTDELFAYDIAVDKNLSAVYHTFTKESMREILDGKPVHPERFNYFMDHAYFSATVLFKKLFEEMKCAVTKASIDAMTAIILHNSLYKFSIAFYKGKENQPFRAGLHPLAYMLMLCDELQCWDRTAYGRNSRTELHPMGCSFVFRDNDILATYLYDKAEESKIKSFTESYRNWENAVRDGKEAGPEPELKSYAGMYTGNHSAISKFQEDIERIVSLNTGDEGIHLTVKTKLEKRNVRNKNTGLSNSNFIHLYNFAVALNGRWERTKEWEAAKRSGVEEDFLSENRGVFEEGFRLLSLEYKLYNINQAKAFTKYLDKIDCFYTDKPVAYEMLEAFTKEDAAVIGPIEHQRWLKEHYEMGWGYTPDTEIDKGKRELLRIHYDMMSDEIVKDNLNGGETIDELLDDENRFARAAKENYNRLDKAEQDKDTEPLNAMLSLLKLYDGLRIYQLERRTQKEPAF